MRRVTKQQAMEELGISLSTLDRRIRNGELEVEVAKHGKGRRVFIMLNGTSNPESLPETLSPDSSVSESPLDVALAISQERVRGLEELVDHLREQVAMERNRYSEIYHDVKTGALMLPEAKSDSAWWRFWERLR